MNAFIVSGIVVFAIVKIIQIKYINKQVSEF